MIEVSKSVLAETVNLSLIVASLNSLSRSDRKGTDVLQSVAYLTEALTDTDVPNSQALLAQENAASRATLASRGYLSVASLTATCALLLGSPSFLVPAATQTLVLTNLLDINTDSD